jgi:DNA polymerase-3 subunit gamma/tau
MNDFDVKYRPTTFGRVIGQDSVVKSLRAALKRKASHAFLFSGPAGIGKTTLARLVAKEVGCESSNLVEIDAATNTGVDAMRDIKRSLSFKAMSGGGTKVLVVDEAHRLSKQAWDSMLKAVEEPPSHVYWIFCTTELGSVPKTIVSRCLSYTLKPVDEDTIFHRLVEVVKEEKLSVSDDVLEMIASKCEGSPRTALSYLSACADCKSRKEAARLMEVAGEDKEAIDLCRHLVKGKVRWASVVPILKSLKGTNAESIRLVIVAYLTSCLLSATDKSAPRFLALLEPFAEPYPTNGGFSNLVLSVGELVYGE